MASAPKTVDRSPTLEQMLRAVRRRIRSYVAVEGFARVVAFGCLTFWLAFAIDWLFEPASRIRQALVVLLAAAIVVVLYRVLLRRFFARIADRNVAILLERRFRTLDDSLLTAIDHPERKKSKAELAAGAATVSSPGHAMVEATRREARSKLAEARFDDLFDPRPRRRALLMALILVLTIPGFAYAMPEIFQLGVDRLAGRTNELYPRKSHLTAVGFNDEGEVVLAKGSDFNLLVLADARMEIPSRIDLYYASDDGMIKEELFMEKEGVAKPDVDKFQSYKTSLHGIASTLHLDIRGGDYRIRDLKIRVVERPQITMTLHTVSPAYTNNSDIPAPVTGLMEVAQGANVSVASVANKPLRSATIERPDGQGKTLTDKLDFVSGGRDPVTEFKFDLGRIDADVVAVIRLFDTDGIEGSAKLSLKAKIDGPPTFKELARSDVDTSVTAQARLPFTGKINDDYGIVQLGFNYQFDGLEPQETPTRIAAAGSREVVLPKRTKTVTDEALDLLEITPGGASAKLAPGRTVTVVLKARDNRKLPGLPEGNAAVGDSFTFTIVSDTDLLRLLEGREIMFREQFKSLIEKVTRDRDSLVDVGKAPPAVKDDEEADEVPRNRDKIIVDQARSHAEENRRETLTVATGFSGIVSEIENNRVPDSDNLRDRFSVDIADPLHRLGELPKKEDVNPVLQGFAAYQAKLMALNLAVDRKTKDAAEIEAARRDAIKSADDILVEMNGVLNKMKELESFKEAVDLLRSIIAMQKDVGDRTKTERKGKDRLKDLAE